MAVWRPRARPGFNPDDGAPARRPATVDPEACFGYRRMCDLRMCLSHEKHAPSWAGATAEKPLCVSGIVPDQRGAEARARPMATAGQELGMGNSLQ